MAYAARFLAGPARRLVAGSDLAISLVQAGGRGRALTEFRQALAQVLDPHVPRVDGAVDQPLGLGRVPGGLAGAIESQLDEAVGLGVILSVARRLDLSLSYLTTGQEVPDDIEVGHRRRIASLVLGQTEEFGRADASPAHVDGAA